MEFSSSDHTYLDTTAVTERSMVHNHRQTLQLDVGTTKENTIATQA